MVGQSIASRIERGFAWGLRPPMRTYTAVPRRTSMVGNARYTPRASRTALSSLTSWQHYRLVCETVTQQKGGYLPILQLKAFQGTLFARGSLRLGRRFRSSSVLDRKIGE